MNVQKYLEDVLRDSSRFSLTSEDITLIENVGIEAFILRKLFSKKYRKFKADGACVSRTQKAVQLTTRNKAPIRLVYPQGGYKLWRFPSSPTVDWAEFFTIAYLLSYVAPIAAAYTPGVHIVYYMHTLLMELHDNLTSDEIQAYVDSFERLLSEFRQYLPKNITLSILKDADLYSRKEYIAALEAGKARAEEEYKTWDEARKEDFSRMARLNIKWQGKEDWTRLSEKEKDEKVYLAALYESAATSQLSKVSEIVKSEDTVLVFTKGSKDFIGIGSTKASIAKYWVGFGVLEKRNDSYLPIILTPSQYQKAIARTYNKEPVSLVKQPNFSEVLVFTESFQFRR